jgi:hypothetical protein
MKQRIFLSALAVGFFMLSANAQQEKALFVNAGQFKNINIADNMKVILTQAPPSAANVSIDKDASDKLRLTMSDGALFIAATKQIRRDYVVYILVNDLQKLTLGEDIDLQTNGILNTSKLDIFIQAGSKAHLKTNGTIDAHPLGDHEVSMTRLAGPLVVIK